MPTAPSVACAHTEKGRLVVFTQQMAGLHERRSCDPSGESCRTCAPSASLLSDAPLGQWKPARLVEREHPVNGPPRGSLPHRWRTQARAIRFLLLYTEDCIAYERSTPQPGRHDRAAAVRCFRPSLRLRIRTRTSRFVPALLPSLSSWSAAVRTGGNHLGGRAASSHRVASFSRSAGRKTRGPPYGGFLARPSRLVRYLSLVAAGLSTRGRLLIQSLRKET